MKVICEVEETDLEGDDGRIIPGVIVRCSECDHEVQCYGVTERSVKRCLAMLHEQCPSGAENFYTTEDD